MEEEIIQREKLAIKIISFRHSLNIGKKVFALKSWDVLKDVDKFVVVKTPEEAVEWAIGEAQMGEDKYPIEL